MDDRPAPQAPRFGVVVPSSGALAQPESIVAVARRAEEVGFDSIWAIDHIVIPASALYIYGEDIYDQLVVLAHLAAVTERVRLGTSVMVVPYRNPIVTAKMLATIDALSGGRLILGVGSGWLEEEFDTLGVDFASRGAATDEALDTFVSLWTRRDEGRSARFGEIRFAPTPVQDPHPPMLIGGNSRRAIRRAVELGQGWHPTTVLSEADLVTLVDHLQTSWVAAGRRGKPEIALGIPVLVTDTPPDPGETWLGARLAAGPPEKIVSELQTLAEFVTHFVIHVVARNREELFAQLELIARDVLPGARLRS
ncbi:MAG: TIGR03619 family F420-dependent LLM class oxidoreductase [bacterium]|nr:TIGR03619 family F420-dependent LLM class oxidoreductase [bacterium]MDE0287137.1 TIGR03619 family F420-dependent LLM class oxidoreductase [bacterium]